MPTNSVDRQILLKHWDSKGEIADMPYHLEVKYFSGEAHLLIAGST